MTKRLFTFFVAVSFAWMSVITPAKAFLPVIGLVLETLLADEAMATSLQFSAIAIGSLIAAVKLNDPKNPSSEIVVRLDPAAALPTPPGYTASSTPGGQPVPPSTTSYTTYYYISPQSTTTYTTPQSACDAYVSTYSSTYSGCVPGTQTPYPTTVTLTLKQGGTTSAGMGHNNVCPSGYNYNVTNCTLGTASQVVKPASGKVEFIRQGDSIVKDPQANPADAVSTPSFTQPSAGNVHATNSDGSSVDININQTDHTTTITLTQPQPNGTTKTTTIHLTPPTITSPTAPPVVDGMNQQVTQGSGTLATSTASATVNVDTSNLATHADVSNVGTKIDTASQSIQDAINCPTCTVPADSTDAQKAAVAAETQKSTDAINNDAISNTQSQYAGNSVFSWPTWIPTFPTGSCAPFSFQLAGHSLSWNFCSYIAIINQILGWLLALLTAWRIQELIFGKAE